MKNKVNSQKKTLLSALILAVLIQPGLSTNGEARMNEQPKRYENRFDFICGIDQQNERVTLHNISIKFHNPNDVPVMLNNLLMLDPEDGALQAESSDRYLNVLLSPDRGFEVDCQNIDELYFEEDGEGRSGMRVFKGYIRSKSIRYLDVVLTYTEVTALGEVID